MHFQKYFPRKGLTKLENHRKSDLIGDPAGADRPADRVCKTAPSAVFSFYPAFSRAALGAVCSVSALVPIALWELLAAVLALWFFYTLIRVFTKRRSLLRWLAGVLLGGERGAVRVCRAVGAQPFRPLRRADAGAGCAGVFQAGAHRRHGLLCRPGERIRRPRRPRCRRQDRLSRLFPSLRPRPRRYAALAERYEQFTGALDPVKPLASWRLFSQTGTTGIFVCFTAEACVNPDTYTAWIPYTMCHELAHRQAVAAEDDANFCAYLACMASGSDDFLLFRRLRRVCLLPQHPLQGRQDRRQPDLVDAVRRRRHRPARGERTLCPV